MLGEDDAGLECAGSGEVVHTSGGTVDALCFRVFAEEVKSTVSRDSAERNNGDEKKDT